MRYILQAYLTLCFLHTTFAQQELNFPEALKSGKKHFLGFQSLYTALFESATKPTRSEVHPWSASPAYFYLTYLAGIQSKKNSFEEIRIAPAFGKLNTIKGTMPTPRGNIHFNLEKKGKMLLAEIEIPVQCVGEIVWNGAITSLRPGKQ